MTNFADILDKTMSETVRPPDPPTGVYHLQVSGLAKMQTRGDFDVVDFPARAIAAGEDVDADALAAYGPLTSIPPLRVSFLFDKNDAIRFQQTENRLKKFLVEVLGLPEGQPYKVAFNEAINKPFMASTRIRVDEKTGDHYFEVDRTTAEA